MKKPSEELLEKIILNHGPEEPDYAFIDQFCLSQPEELKLIRKETLSFLHSKESIMGHIYLKPYGYAGDFHIIDRIYTKSASSKFEKWDRYSLENSAAKAVRNRKEYFKSILQGLHESGEKVNVLNVASGPARDVFEFFSEHPDSKLHFTCVDLDADAIAYAKNLNRDHLHKVEFIHKNILRFEAAGKYDLIWSAGLFDYFSDKAFISIIERMKNWLSEDGEIIIGNFNQEHNPSRNYMEIIGEWYLHHRTAKELEALALQAGFGQNGISVGRESENVNLFLHLRHHV